MASNGRNALGRFVTGNSGGPGRPKGSRNRLGEESRRVLTWSYDELARALIEGGGAGGGYGVSRGEPALLDQNRQ